MAKKPQRHDWPDATKLCRLNQDDIAVAKRLGLRPDTLIRNRPDPRQKWILPVKHREKPSVSSAPRRLDTTKQGSDLRRSALVRSRSKAVTQAARPGGQG